MHETRSAGLTRRRVRAWPGASLNPDLPGPGNWTFFFYPPTQDEKIIMIIIKINSNISSKEMNTILTLPMEV